jgi:hypothetical protein
MRKDFADAFAAEGEAARERLKDLKGRGVDALSLELSEAPRGSNNLGTYRTAKEHILPLLPKLEDEGERDAALRDVAGKLKLSIRSLRKALAAMVEQARETQEKQEHELADETAGEEPVTPVEVERIEKLVGSPGVLGRYVEDAAGIHGVVGDRDMLSLASLVAFSAQADPLPNGKPAGVNLIITAAAGRGKNHVCDAVASLLPEEFKEKFESASAKSLYYKAERDPTILKHKWIYPNEAEATDQLVEMFRPLLSGGEASHLTVNKNGDGRNAAQELNVEGPVTVTIPTIRNKLDGQLQTRMLVAELPDYEGRVAAHSRAFSKLLLPDRAGEDYGPKIRAWQASLRSLIEVRKVVDGAFVDCQISGLIKEDIRGPHRVGYVVQLLLALL